MLAMFVHRPVTPMPLEGIIMARLSARPYQWG
jgi:hypothetical protein